MKTQIRKGVFETNSSSVHALALDRDFSYGCDDCRKPHSTIMPQHIVLEVELESSYYDTNKWVGKNYVNCTQTEIITNKIKFVYSNILNRMKSSEYDEFPTYGYINLTMFFGWLNKLGITYEIPFEPEKFYVDKDNILEKHDVILIDDFDDKLWNIIFDGTEEAFCNFLFGDGSQVSGYETDMIGYGEDYDKFVDDFEKRMKNKGKCNLYQH